MSGIDEALIFLKKARESAFFGRPRRRPLPRGGFTIADGMVKERV